MKQGKLRCGHCGHECGHVENIHRRTFSIPMVRALRFLAERDGYVHVTEGGKQIDGRTNYGKLKHLWQLAIDDPDRNGYWKITERGWSVLTGELSITKSYWVGDNNNIVGVADATLVNAPTITGEPYDGPRRAPEYEKVRREQQESFR